MANALDDALADNYMKRDVSEEGVGAVLQQTAFSVGWQVPGLRDDLRARVRSGAKAKASKRVATASASIAAAVESAGDAIENAFEEPPPPQPETLSDYVFGVQAKPEDAPAPSYSDAAYAAVFGAAPGVLSAKHWGGERLWRILLLLRSTSSGIPRATRHHSTRAVLAHGNCHHAVQDGGRYLRKLRVGTPLRHEVRIVNGGLVYHVGVL